MFHDQYRLAGQNPSLYDVPTLQVGQAVTHIASNGSHVPEIITKVTICYIYGDPMYLLEGTPNQYHQKNIDCLCEPSNTNIFLINITIRPLHTNSKTKTPTTTIGFVTH